MQTTSVITIVAVGQRALHIIGVDEAVLVQHVSDSLRLVKKIASVHVVVDARAKKLARQTQILDEKWRKQHKEVAHALVSTRRRQ